MTEDLISDDQGILYISVPYFAADKQRSHWTIRYWIRTGQARTLTRSNVRYIHWGDALRLHEGRATQRRSLPRKAS